MEKTMLVNSRLIHFGLLLLYLIFVVIEEGNKIDASPPKRGIDVHQVDTGHHMTSSKHGASRNISGTSQTGRRLPIYPLNARHKRVESEETVYPEPSSIRETERRVGIPRTEDSTNGTLAGKIGKTPCLPSSCENGARCSEAEDPWGWGFYCLCDWNSRRFGGRRCQIVDPCRRYPCLPPAVRCAVGYNDRYGRTCYAQGGVLVPDTPLQ